MTGRNDDSKERPVSPPAADVEPISHEDYWQGFIPEHSGHSMSASDNDWERLYDETEDLKYVVSAIGRWPKRPPRWALDACEQFYKRQESAAQSRRPDKDGELLDRAADLMASAKVGNEATGRKGRIVHPAIKTVVADLASLKPQDIEDDHSEIRRLRQLWDKEGKAAGATVIWEHPRFERASVRLAKRHGAHMPDRWDP